VKEKQAELTAFIGHQLTIIKPNKLSISESLKPQGYNEKIFHRYAKHFRHVPLCPHKPNEHVRKNPAFSEDLTLRPVVIEAIEETVAQESTSSPSR
jgi:hypothetical protein